MTIDMSGLTAMGATVDASAEVDGVINYVGAGGADAFTGVAGNDNLNGGADTDTVDYSNAAAAVKRQPSQYRLNQLRGRFADIGTRAKVGGIRSGFVQHPGEPCRLVQFG